MAPTSSRVLAYCQLLRLPNVFTVVADVWMGFLVTHDLPAPWLLMAPLLVASIALYWAGMVLNDYYDRDRDALERPERPIPSRRVPTEVAHRLGFGLLAIGVFAAWTASAMTSDLRAGVIGTLLAATAWCYDALAKQTALGPLVMGACRSLNVLLAMSALAGPWQTMHLLIAGGLGLYIVGVTCLARSEVGQSQRAPLSVATLLMLGGIGLLASYPAFATADAPLHVPQHWNLFWLLIAAGTAGRCLQAIANPQPAVVQGAVKSSILSLIVLDAGVVVPVQDLYWALSILFLLIPTVWLGRWMYST